RAREVGCSHLFGLRCSPRAAGLDEIRGSTPNQSLELIGSLAHAGLADPGPTYAAITSFIALATEEGNLWSRAQGTMSVSNLITVIVVSFSNLSV
ncbi:MAG TPA: hypothetical protein VD978_12415, partial [Azospirillum sp.]|nr:hypothetical protein [Azospirillum sp.]